MGKERKKKSKKKAANTTKKTASSSDDSNKLESGVLSENDCENGSTEEQNSKGKNNYNVADLLRKIEDCMDSFNFDLAVKFCERALEIEPNNSEVLEMTGAVFMENGETEKAKSCFQSAVQLSPETGYSKYMNLGQLLEGQEAIAAYQKGIELMLASKDEPLQAGASNSMMASSTDISMAYCSLAEIYLTDECFGSNAESKCHECCQKAIEYDQTNPEALQLMASCLLSQQNMEDARKMLEKSLELWQGKDDNLPQAPVPSYESRITTSKLLIEVENFELASEMLEDLIEESDEVPQVWYLLGWISHMTNQESSCVRTYLEKAQTLFTTFGCEDQPMMDHIKEILNSLPEDTEETLDEENGDANDASSSAEENMDTQ